MNILEALVLGIVQGLTEFLPISSKTHLIIIPALFGWSEPPIPYVVLLHAGTLVAALVYFRRDIIEAIDGLDRPSAGRRVMLLLLLGTIPAALVGFLLEDRITRLFNDAALAAGLLIATGVILVITEALFRRRARPQAIEETAFSNVEKISAEVSPGKAVFIGLAQCLALLPGISRAGSTIGAGLIAKLSRPQAARFSFMLSIPIIAGTSLAEIPKLADAHLEAGPLIVGFFASLIAGYVAIAGMIGYLQKRGLFPFAAYCFIVGPVAALILSSR